MAEAALVDVFLSEAREELTAAAAACRGASGCRPEPLLDLAECHRALGEAERPPATCSVVERGGPRVLVVSDPAEFWVAKYLAVVIG